MKIINWDEVKKFVKDRDPVSLDAGILNDWFWTAAEVYKDGKWLDIDKAYVVSSWASPGFKATMKNGDVVEIYSEKEMSDGELEIYEQKRKECKESLRKCAEEIRKNNGEL